MLRDLLAAMDILVVRSDPGTDLERVGLFHETLVAHLAGQTSGTTLESAHRAILNAIEDLAPYNPQVAEYQRLHQANHMWAVGDHQSALTTVYSRLGHKPGENIELLTPWLERAAQTIGADHPETLAARNRLAGAYLRPATSTEPSPCSNRPSPTANGSSAPTTPTRSPLATTSPTPTSRPATWTAPSPCYEQTLTDRERVLGPDHPDTLTSRNNLAGAYQSAGDLDQAIALYEQTLTDRERMLGPDHPDTLTSRNNLAFAYQSAGRPDQADPPVEQTLTDRERILGPDHPDTLTSRNNLAGAYEAAGDLDRPSRCTSRPSPTASGSSAPTTPTP